MCSSVVRSWVCSSIVTSSNPSRSLKWVPDYKLQDPVRYVKVCVSWPEYLRSFYIYIYTHMMVLYHHCYFPPSHKICLFSFSYRLKHVISMIRIINLNIQLDFEYPLPQAGLRLWSNASWILDSRLPMAAGLRLWSTKVATLAFGLLSISISPSWIWLLQRVILYR